MTLLSQPLPWYIAGPLIGLTVPLVYLYAGRKWGVSSSFRDMCAAAMPNGPEYLRYDWRKQGSWRLSMVLGLLIGAAVASATGPADVAISSATVADLAALGITNFDGLVPAELFSWSSLATVPGAILIIGGGFLVGFGARYADGCTSGHAIAGLANLRVSSLMATVAFFVGGLISTHLLLPLIMGGAS